jgi:periplasmic protein CpxP/Spy
MPSLYRPVAISARVSRATAIAALLSATMLAAPSTGALAASMAGAPLQLAQATTPQTPPTSPAPTAAPAQPAPQTQAAPQPQAGATTAETKAETVEQRITNLHTALEITPKEEPKWDHVARVMRDNAAAMQKLIADRDSQDPSTITAVQDLREYEKFAQAHVTGLRKLTASFEALYNAMPAAQKKVADQVFQNFGHHKAAAAHS